MGDGLRQAAARWFVGLLLKARPAPPGAVHRWHDGKLHRKMPGGDWQAVATEHRGEHATVSIAHDKSDRGSWMDLPEYTPNKSLTSGKSNFDVLASLLSLDFSQENPRAQIEARLASVGLPPEATREEYRNAIMQRLPPDQRPPIMTEAERMESRRARDAARYRPWPGVSLDGADD